MGRGIPGISVPVGVPGMGAGKLGTAGWQAEGTDFQRFSANPGGADRGSPQTPTGAMQRKAGGNSLRSVPPSERNRKQL
jgi:hypothetical protein